jgi:hypothetical protein
MTPPPQGLTPEAFAALKAELPQLADRLSDDQILCLADSLHSLLRTRQTRRSPGRVTLVYAGLNDNRPLPLPPIESPYA